LETHVPHVLLAQRYKDGHHSLVTPIDWKQQSFSLVYRDLGLEVTTRW
jgi:hypothetical protein